MTARAILLVGLFLLFLTFLRHWGEKPQLAVTNADMPQGRVLVCLSPMQVCGKGVCKKPRSLA